MEEFNTQSEQKDPKEEFKGFKKWFQVMWKNFYIQIFILALTAITIILIKRDDFEGGSVLIALAIPIAVLIVVVFKGFYQFWRDLQQGTSR